MAGTAFKNLALNTLVLTDADYTALETTVGQNTGDISALQTRCTTIEGAATALTGRVTTNEGDIAGLRTRCGTIEGAIGDCVADDPAAPKSYVDSQVSTIPKFNIEVVSALPESNISYSTVYLLKTGDEEGNLYEEYIRVKGKNGAADSWEKLGTQRVDLSGYYTKTEADAAIQSAISGKLDAELAQSFARVDSDWLKDGMGNAIDAGKIQTANGNSVESELSGRAYKNGDSSENFVANGLQVFADANVDGTVTAADVLVGSASFRTVVDQVGTKANALGNVSESTTVAELIAKLSGTIVSA